MDESRVNFYISKKIEMLLLKSNELEIIEKLEKEGENNNIIFYKYYLLPKEWLDEYKIKYDYLPINEKLNHINKKNFSELKSYLENNNNLDIENVGIQINNDIELPSIKDDEFYMRIYFENNNDVYFPKNFVLIREDLYKDYINPDLENSLNTALYDIYFTKEKIYVTDNDINKNNIFVCLYNKNENCFKLDQLIRFKEEINFKDKINCINSNALNYIVSDVDINQKEMRSDLILGHNYMDSASLKASHFIYESGVTQLNINILKEDNRAMNNNNKFQFNINNPIMENNNRNYIYNIKGDLYSYIGDNNNFENNIMISDL